MVPYPRIFLRNPITPPPSYLYTLQLSAKTFFTIERCIFNPWYFYHCSFFFFFGICVENSLNFSDPSTTAIHRVLSLLSNANFSVIVSGMERIAPIKPSRLPQKISERKTTKVESPNFLPIRRGSITLPIMNPMRILPAITSRALPIPS